MNATNAVVYAVFNAIASYFGIHNMAMLGIYVKVFEGMGVVRV